MNTIGVINIVSVIYVLCTHNVWHMAWWNYMGEECEFLASQHCFIARNDQNIEVYHFYY